MVDRRDCFEVTERIGRGGEVATPLDEAEVEAALIPALRAGGYDAVALCLLGAYAEPRHEVRLREMLEAALPDLRIACSHEIAAEFREYERATTTTPTMGDFEAQFAANASSASVVTLA